MCPYNTEKPAQGDTTKSEITMRRYTGIKQARTEKVLSIALFKYQTSIKHQKIQN